MPDYEAAARSSRRPFDPLAAMCAARAARQKCHAEDQKKTRGVTWRCGYTVPAMWYKYMYRCVSREGCEDFSKETGAALTCLPPVTTVAASPVWRLKLEHGAT